MTDKPTKKRADHYVPVVFLKGFADPQFDERGDLHVYDFRAGTYEISNPRDAAKRPTPDPESADVVFRSIETRIGPVLHSLIKHGKMPVGARLNDLIEFMAMQVIRSPLHHEGVDKAYLNGALIEAKNFCRDKASRRRFRDRMMRNGDDGSTTPEDVVSGIEQAIERGVSSTLEWMLATSLQEVPALQAKFKTMTWSPIRFQVAPSFVTSNDPVRMTVSDVPSPKLKHIDDPSAQIFFPIAPNLLIYGGRRPVKRSQLEMPGEFVAKVNEMMQRGSTQVYSKTERFVTMIDGKVKEARINPALKELGPEQ